MRQTDKIIKYTDLLFDLTLDAGNLAYLELWNLIQKHAFDITKEHKTTIDIKAEYTAMHFY